MDWNPTPPIIHSVGSTIALNVGQPHLPLGVPLSEGQTYRLPEMFLQSSTNFLASRKLGQAILLAMLILFPQCLSHRLVQARPNLVEIADKLAVDLPLLDVH